jgi:hypothetical protein
MPETVAALVVRAIAGIASLASFAETVGDEWQYVTDLTTVWRGRLQAVADAHGDRPAESGAVVAVDHALAEITRITDPHRAIDWLSTFPQVVLLVLGEEDRVGPASARGR